jgi:hypothetical protein
VLVVVAIVAISLWQLSRANKFNLLCFSDCGEVFISELQLRNVDLFGAKYGLLEDQATSADPAGHPFLYTHNVNIGSLIALALDAAGVKTLEQRQLAVLLFFALSLWLTFAATLRLTSSPECAVVVTVLIGTQAFIFNYALHGLRVFHLVALMLGLLFYTRLFRGEWGSWSLFGLAVLSALVSFGIGYEFWLVASASVVLAILLLLLISRLFADPIPTGRAVRLLGIYAAANALVFGARQAQVIAVLGWKYWISDFYYSFVIKVPGAAAIFGSADPADVDAFYATWHVLRPPASAITAANLDQYLGLLKTHFAFSALPKLGSFHLLVLAGFLVWGLALVLRHIRATAKNRAATMPMPKELPAFVAVLALTLGYVLGCVLFLQLWIDHYTAHLHPFLVVPVAMASGIVAIMACHVALRLLRSSAPALGGLALLGAVAIIASHVVVQRENLAASVAAPFDWIDEVRRRADHSFAISFTGAAASAFNRDYVLELAPSNSTRTFERLARGETPFTADMISQFGEKGDRSAYLHPDFWLYFNSDRRTDTWARKPICRHDWLLRAAFSLAWQRKPEVKLPESLSAPPGDVLLLQGSVIDPARRIADVVISSDGIRADTLYNCAFGKVATVMRLPADLPAGSHVAEVRMLSATGALVELRRIAIEVSPTAPLGDVDRIYSAGPMLSIEEISARYPGMPVAARGSDYLLFDLRGLRH